MSRRTPCSASSRLRRSRPASHENGSMDKNPLKTHVHVNAPKISPKITCHRFAPVYGTLEGAPRNLYRFAGEYSQIPATRPSSEVAAPAAETHMTTRLQCAAWRRNTAKYSQCGMAPK